MTAPTDHPASPTPRIAAAVLVALFLGCGLIRLNSFCLLEPDTADYLFTSRALVTLDGYREIDHPAQPLHAFRPPGLPLLLAPLSAVRPYDVVRAKSLVLALSAVLLALTYVLAARTAGHWAGLATLALVATSPYTLLHGTEVVSEIPYLAAMLGVVVLVTGRHEPPGRGRLVSVGLLLALLPLVRTVGLALLAALACWTLFDRPRRRRWWIPIGAGLLVNALWMARNAATGLPTYLSAMRRDLLELGVAGYAAKAGDALLYYAERIGGVLLPGVFSGQPLYERLLLDEARDLGGAYGAGGIVVLGALALAGVGLWARRGADGGIVAAYAALFAALLAVYPPRHERLLWPLIPLVWIYAPAGLSVLVRRLPHGAAPRVVLGLAIASAAAVCGWQGSIVAAIAGAELRREGEGALFYRHSAPPVYFSDWQAAGRWIRENTPAHARVLTRHSDVGFTARRFQDSVRFEEISPSTLHERIARLRARYLVLPTTLFDWLVPAAVRSGSPVYAFEPVHRERGVVVFEVRPNRDGRVRLTDDDLAARLVDCRDVAGRHPERTDLARRLAELLHEAGRSDDALRVLDEFVARSGSDAGIAKTRGTLLLDANRPAAASEAFESAQALPGGEQLARSLERGRLSAAEALARSEREAPLDTARHLARSAVGGVRAQVYRAAWREIERAAAAAPDDPAVRLARAAILERIGRRDEAHAVLVPLATAGDARAQALLDRIEDEDRLFRGDDAADPEACARVAARLAGEGSTGRALDLLERGVERYPAAEGLRLRLAELYLFYGLAERAEPLFRTLVEAGSTHAGTARRGLETCRELLRQPEY